MQSSTVLLPTAYLRLASRDHPLFPAHNCAINRIDALSHGRAIIPRSYSQICEWWYALVDCDRACGRMHAFHWPQRSRPSRGTIVEDTEALRRDQKRRSQIIHVPHQRPTDILRPSGWKMAIVLLKKSSNRADGTSESEMPLSVTSRFRFFIPHSMTVPSSDAKASSLSSGEIAVALTLSGWP
jgi:hypothetical protein